jgi:hypothetical protein
MSTKYKHGDVVPTEVLAKRLDELSDAVVSRMNRDNATFEREFTCRIPAELDRDADLVFSEASKRLIELEKRIAELEEELEQTCESFTKTMEFVLENHEVDFLSCWIEGDWDGCREWSEDYDLDAAIFYPEKIFKGGE